MTEIYFSSGEMESLRKTAKEEEITVEELVSKRVSAGIASKPGFIVAGASSVVFDIRFRKDH